MEWNRRRYRRQTHVSPKTYLNFLDSFKRVYDSKVTVLYRVLPFFYSVEKSIAQ